MAYFETTIINYNSDGTYDRNDFEISVNEDLYNYLTCHPNQNSGGEDWFDIQLNHKDVKNIRELCKTNEEKQLIGEKIQDGSIIDILIHRGILIKGE